MSSWSSRPTLAPATLDGKTHKDLPKEVELWSNAWTSPGVATHKPKHHKCFVGLTRQAPLSSLSPMAIEAEGSDEFWGKFKDPTGEPTLYHKHPDWFPPVLKYNGRFYVSYYDAHAVNQKAKFGVSGWRFYTKHQTELAKKLSLYKLSDAKRVDNIYVFSATPVNLQLFVVQVQENCTLYELTPGWPANWYGPSHAMSTGYNNWYEGNSSLAAHLGENIDDPQLGQVDPKHALEGNCDSLPIKILNDTCHAAQAYNSFYNSPETPWYANINNASGAWSRYYESPTRASFVDGSIAADGITSTAPIMDSNNGYYTTTIHGLYYCPLTYMGYPIFLSGTKTTPKWLDFSTKTRQVWIDTSKPFMTTISNVTPGMIIQYRAIAPGIPPAIMLMPNYYWNKHVVVKQCSGRPASVHLHYNKYADRWMPKSIIKTADEQTYANNHDETVWNKRVSEGFVLSHEFWEHHQYFDKASRERLLEFGRYYCHEASAWLFFFDGSMPKSIYDYNRKHKLIPGPDVNHTYTVDKYIGFDMETIGICAALEIPIAYASRNNYPLAVVPLTFVGMVGAAVAYKNRDDTIDAILDSLWDQWVDLQKLFREGKHLSKQAEKDAEAARRDALYIGVAVTGLTLTGLSMYYTYYMFGEASSNLLASEFGIGIVTTGIAEIVVAIQKNKTIQSIEKRL